MSDLSGLRGRLIVSCQARPDNPLHGPVHMSAAARAAVAGGASGIRAEGAPDIRAIRAAVDVPIIGIRKVLDGRPVYITPSFAAAREVVEAGADIVALDATMRDRGDDDPPHQLIRRVRDELGVLVMADIDDLDSAEAAAIAGADLVATTLSGYTHDGPPPSVPDLELIRRLEADLDIPVVAEGRIWTPEDAVSAFEAGAWAVVVGTAITNPQRITGRFVNRIEVVGRTISHERYAHRAG